MELLKKLLANLRGDPQAVVRYRAADAELQRIAGRDRAETEEWAAANDAFWLAREAVPWWRR